MRIRERERERERATEWNGTEGDGATTNGGAAADAEETRSEIPRRVPA
jgi:hypothetical protein